MSRYLIQNSIWWIEYSGIAGIRQDTYSYPFREFMTDWTCAIRDEYPEFFIVGEEWVDDPAVISYWQEGKVNQDGYTSCLPSVMDFPLTFATHKAMTEDEGWGTGLIKLYEKLGQDFNYADPSQLVIFPDNHDMSRIFTQVNEDVALYKMALVYMLTTRGIPQIYYGTEIMMSNKGTTSHGVIRSDFPGGWDGDLISIKDNKGITQLQQQGLDFHRKLLKWRQSKQVIHSGKLMHFAPQDGVYVYFRYLEDEAVMVILNKNKEDYQLPLKNFHERLSGYKTGVNIMTDTNVVISDSLTLVPMSAAIIELNR